VKTKAELPDFKKKFNALKIGGTALDKDDRD